LTVRRQKKFWIVPTSINGGTEKKVARTKKKEGKVKRTYLMLEESSFSLHNNDGEESFKGKRRRHILGKETGMDRGSKDQVTGRIATGKADGQANTVERRKGNNLKREEFLSQRDSVPCPPGGRSGPMVVSALRKEGEVFEITTKVLRFGVRAPKLNVTGGWP